MRIARFASEDEKIAFQEAKELELAASLGAAGRWTLFLAGLAGMPVLSSCATTPTAIAREQSTVTTASSG